MTDPPELDQAAMLDLVRDAVLAHDPVPAEVLAAARGSYAWLTIDADLADLVEDSALEPLAGVRGAGPRLLTFEAEESTVVVEVTATGNVRRMLGQLVSPRAADIEVRHPHGSLTVQADDLGRFSVDVVPAGPVSLACRFPGGARQIVTSWVTV